MTERVIDPAVAYLTVSLMEDVVNQGTGSGVRAAGFRSPAAGKTGTTQDAADAWFVGITPTLVGTVWMGFDRRQRILRGVTGGEIAAPVWARVMRAIGAGSRGWPVPAGVEQHLVTAMGAVIGDGCPPDRGARQEYFLAGTAPVTSCWVDPYLAYADTIGVYGDSIWADEQRRAEQESWWDRLRSRFFDRGDTLRPRPDQWPPDTAVVLPDTLPLPVVPRPDSVRVWPGRTHPDSVRTHPDTLWPPPDTTRIRSRPDTMRTRPDTIRPRPDTIRIPPDTVPNQPSDEQALGGWGAPPPGGC
jgi:membrane peptidoglycan carboxypeptidase